MPRLRDRVCSPGTVLSVREPLVGLCMWLTTASTVELSMAAASVADRAGFSTADLVVSTGVPLVLSVGQSTALERVVRQRFITIAHRAPRVAMRPTTVALAAPGARRLGPTMGVDPRASAAAPTMAARLARPTTAIMAARARAAQPMRVTVAPAEPGAPLEQPTAAGATPRLLAAPTTARGRPRALLTAVVVRNSRIPRSRHSLT